MGSKKKFPVLSAMDISEWVFPGTSRPSLVCHRQNFCAMRTNPMTRPQPEGHSAMCFSWCSRSRTCTEYNLLPLQSDSHYSSHSSSNTLSSNASSAHSDEKWYDGDRTESELNSYNYLQGTSADSGIDTTSYGPSHGSTASLGAATSSPRSGPGKEKVAPLWHSSSEVISMVDRTLDTESHGMDRKTESSLSLDIHSKSQAGSSPLTRENSTFSINDAASHTR